MTKYLASHPDEDFRLRHPYEVQQLLQEAGILQHMGIGVNGLPTKTMVSISICGSKTHAIIGVSVVEPSSKQPSLQAIALSKRKHDTCDAAQVAMEVMRSIGPAIKISKVPNAPLVKN
ncbi:MAG TPA: hypothetical protein VJU02_04620 [Nitrospiraceae bacterium]|nr:hypothetical protein [Nitrospiraceae bacterium]